MNAISADSNWLGFLPVGCRCFFVVILGGHLSVQLLSCPQKRHKFGNETRCWRIFKRPRLQQPAGRRLHTERMLSYDEYRDQGLTEELYPQDPLDTRQTGHPPVSRQTARLSAAMGETTKAHFGRTRSLPLAADGLCGRHENRDFMSHENKSFSSSSRRYRICLAMEIAISRLPSRCTSR